MSNREATLAAIQNARKDYLFGNPEPVAGQKPIDVFRRNADSEYIKKREHFINGPHADSDAIALAVRMDMVHIAPSGHKYIQLG